MGLSRKEGSGEILIIGYNKGDSMPIKETDYV